VAEERIDPKRSRLALIVLVVIDAMSFLAIDRDQSGLIFGLVGSKIAFIQLGIDAVLAYGMIKASRWAVELARYRCILGVCYLCFLWLSLMMTHDAGTFLLSLPTVQAAVYRDSLIGFLLLGALFLIREQKAVKIPMLDPAEAEKATGDQASEEGQAQPTKAGGPDA
jgi:hypothetical protein